MTVEFSRKSLGWMVVWSAVLSLDEVLPQLDDLLFSSVEGLLVESVEATDTVVRIDARTTAGQMACPGCRC
ncbi:hypothetical protein RCO28_27370 [Streptomyces sp. LHD-70]|uniref:hypothetical protein n=1 Tax=Streptomyces sp. LHD-70 TaxID=3072140 RepID=UPI0028109B10|nr:hypothetical protein [Streptomyces sp. LHD-70]MDQ8706161.1 hypothetical protein [Streptomyces sp. LHD-70]